eukprot:TRINITY_DN7762_c0_g1_i1.p1 TRINITY_DN7762_c0_g1~~TRINITY_DN7762_c0_g1_i1.p1  ORF type:complete len:1452 (+),score=359.51 TRINITY_DN7762_c0_g1_i1:18-4373(+)
MLNQIHEHCHELLLNLKKLAVSTTNNETELYLQTKEILAPTVGILTIAKGYPIVQGREGITQLLFEYSEEMRDTVVLFIKHRKKLLTNPLDFMTQQDVKNSQNEVVKSVKKVFQVAKTMLQMEGTSKTDNESADKMNISKQTASVINSTSKKIFIALSELEQKVESKDLSGFRNTARTVVNSFKELKDLFDSYSQFKTQIEELLEHSRKTISMAGFTFQKKEEVYIVQFLAQKDKFEEGIRALIIEASSQSHKLSQSITEDESPTVKAAEDIDTPQKQSESSATSQINNPSIRILESPSTPNSGLIKRQPSSPTMKRLTSSDSLDALLSPRKRSREYLFQKSDVENALSPPERSIQPPAPVQVPLATTNESLDSESEDSLEQMNEARARDEEDPLKSASKLNQQDDEIPREGDESKTSNNDENNDKSLSMSSPWPPIHPHRRPFSEVLSSSSPDILSSFDSDSTKEKRRDKFPEKTKRRSSSKKTKPIITTTKKLPSTPPLVISPTSTPPEKKKLPQVPNVKSPPPPATTGSASSSPTQPPKFPVPIVPVLQLSPPSATVLPALTPTSIPPPPPPHANNTSFVAEHRKTRITQRKSVRLENLNKNDVVENILAILKDEYPVKDNHNIDHEKLNYVRILILSELARFEASVERQYDIRQQELGQNNVKKQHERSMTTYPLSSQRDVPESNTLSRSISERPKLFIDSRVKKENNDLISSNEGENVQSVVQKTGQPVLHLSSLAKAMLKVPQASPSSFDSSSDMDKIIAIASPRSLNSFTVQPKKQGFTFKSKGRKTGVKLLSFSTEGNNPQFKILSFSDACKGFFHHSHALISHFDQLHREYHKDFDKSSQIDKQSLRHDGEKKRKQFYSHIQEVNNLINSIFKFIEDSGLCVPNTVLVDALASAKLSVDESITQRTSNHFAGNLTVELPEELFHTGRYDLLIKTNILISLHHKTNLFFFSVSQVLTDLNDLLTQLTMENVPCILHLLALIISLTKIMKSIMEDAETLYYLDYISQSEQSEPKLHRHTMDIDEESIVKKLWSEDAILKAESMLGEEKFHPGNLENLTIRLTPYPPNAPSSLYVSTFASTCTRFCSSATIIEYLFGRYRVPRSKIEEDSISARGVQSLVLSSLLLFYQYNYFVIDTSLEQRILQFVDKIIDSKEDEPCHRAAAAIKQEIYKNYFSLPSQYLAKPAPKIPAFGGEVQPFQSMLAFDENIVAEQLTLIEFEIYSRIKFEELVGQAWNKPSLKCLSRNVVELIRRANCVSFWVATSVLLLPQRKDRSNAITRFINIAKALYDMKNFNSLMSVIAGLNTISVSRLKHSWNGVRSQKLEVLRELQNIMHPSKSFQNLRAAIHEGTQKLIPYIGMYLSDLTFIEDGNVDEVLSDEGKTLINFSKHHMLYKAIDELLKFQIFSSDFSKIPRKEPVFTFLFELAVLDEEDLYKLSLEREPKE